MVRKLLQRRLDSFSRTVFFPRVPEMDDFENQHFSASPCWRMIEDRPKVVRLMRDPSRVRFRELPRHRSLHQILEPRLTASIAAANWTLRFCSSRLSALSKTSCMSINNSNVSSGARGILDLTQYRLKGLCFHMALIKTVESPECLIDKKQTLFRISEVLFKSG